MFFNLWISSKCNLSCSYCYCKENIGSAIEVDVYKFVDYILSESELDSRNWINFHGGEPLLQWSAIEEIIGLLEKSKFKYQYSFTTNGTIMNQRIINMIQDYNIDISLSCDGKQSTHDLYRKFPNGKGSYEIMNETLAMLVENHIELRIRLTFNSITVHSLYENVLYFLKTGLNRVAIAPDYFDTNWNEKSIQVYSQQLYAIKKAIYQTDYQFDYVEKKSLHHYVSCKGGKGGIQINANGDLYPCSYCMHHSMFHIGSIETGINQHKVDDLIRACEQINKPCKGCSIQPYCISSRCKYINHVISGSMNNPSGIVCALERCRILNAYRDVQ